MSKLNKSFVQYSIELDDAMSSNINQAKGDYQYKLACLKPVARYAKEHENAPLIQKNFGGKTKIAKKVKKASLTKTSTKDRSRYIKH